MDNLKDCRVSEPRACRLTGFIRSASWHPLKGRDDAELKALAERYPRYGYLELHDMLRTEEARADLAQWIREGQIHYRDDIVEGLDEAPSHLLRLFSGEHRGKLLVKLADAEGWE